MGEYKSWEIRGEAMKILSLYMALREEAKRTR